MWDDEESFIADMLDSGCARRVYWEEDEQMVEWDMKKLEILYPAVHQSLLEAHLEEVKDALSNLVDKGYLDMSFEENDEGEIEAVYMLNEYGGSHVEEMLGRNRDE